MFKILVFCFKLTMMHKLVVIVWVLVWLQNIIKINIRVEIDLMLLLIIIIIFTIETNSIAKSLFSQLKQFPNSSPIFKQMHITIKLPKPNQTSFQIKSFRSFQKISNLFPHNIQHPIIKILTLTDTYQQSATIFHLQQLGMQKQNKIYKTDSKERWSCGNCHFDNLALLAVCQICQTSREKQPHSLEDRESKIQPGIQCPQSSCKFYNSLMNQECQKCGRALFIQQNQQIPSKSQIKKEIEMLNCRSCGFANDPINRVCVGCDRKLQAKKIPRKSIKSKRAAYGSTAQCPTCGQQLRIIDYATKETDVCMECQKKYPSQHVKTLCLFCDKKLTYQEQKIHDQKCADRKQFYGKEGNSTYDRCTPLQIETMIYMHRKCQVLHYKKQNVLVARVRKLGYSSQDLQNLHHYIMHYAPIIIHMHVNTHFHFFLKDTHYRNQFETSMSSGSLSHSARTGWEDRMFDSKHHGASGFQRVKYGTMNFTNDPTGVRVCAGYGQSYFLLKSHVRDRCTITDMDSSAANSTLGTFRFIFHLLMKLSDAELKSAFQGSKGKEMLSNVIGAYKEIQIHGPVQFSKDIERLYISKDQMKLGDAKAILEQVKTFCSKNGIDYELFQQNKVVAPIVYGGMAAVDGISAPERIVGDKKELTEQDLKPPVPVAGLYGAYGGGLGLFGGGGGFVGGFGGGFGVGFGGVSAAGFSFAAPKPAVPLPPPIRKKQFGVDYI